MNYPQVRRQIRSGDLLAWSHRGWRSWHDFKIQMVRAFTQSEYSHVGLAWVVGDRVFVLEAVQPKVRIYPLSKLGDFYWLPMGAAWKAETEALALAHVGDDYDQIVAIQAFFKPLHSGNTHECAAYVRTVMFADGIDLGPRATPDAVIRTAMRHYDAQPHYIQGT